MQRYTVTLIGMGPRGLSVFERLAAVALARQLPLDIVVVDPGECGQGTHLAQQPPYLLINTLACQVTLFPAAGAVQHAPVCATPTLTEWARQAGIPVTDADYLPRSLLGEYLGWCYAQIAAALPTGAALTHHRLLAIDLQRRQDGRCEVVLADGSVVVSDFVCLTTGHGASHAYPAQQLAHIAAGARVAIQGLGLTAHDVIAGLTVGRGGSFVASGSGLRYLASGREPQLTLCSRNCLPYAARGINQKGVDGRHQPRYFTLDAVAMLRRQSLIQRGTTQLDFERDLLPLLKREMAEVYRATPGAAARDNDALDNDALFAELLFPTQDRQFASLAEFRRYFRDWLERDLAEARKGNVASPTKAATDVLRDVRAVLQAVVEHGGLTPASHRRYLAVYHPAINRTAFGPPLRRNEELLALLDAGVIALHAGPGNSIDAHTLRTPFAQGVECWTADVILMARLAGFSPKTDTSLLIRNVLQRGLVQPYYNGDFHPGGLAINRAGQLLDAQDKVQPNLWALGYPAEGPHYYTYALPRPQLRSRQVLDAEQCVMAMAATMEGHREDRQPYKTMAAQIHGTL